MIFKLNMRVLFLAGVFVTLSFFDPVEAQELLRGLKGIDKILEQRFGKTAMLMNAWTDPGPAEELLKNEIVKHVEKKFDAEIDKNKKGSG